MARVVIWISGSTQDLLDTYGIKDYDELIRKLVFFEKQGIPMLLDLPTAKEKST